MCACGFFYAPVVVIQQFVQNINVCLQRIIRTRVTSEFKLNGLVLLLFIFSGFFAKAVFFGMTVRVRAKARKRKSEAGIERGRKFYTRYY